MMAGAALSSASVGFAQVDGVAAGQSAMTAVSTLGKRLVAGDHKAALDKMFPKLKERMAKREGSLRAIEEKFESIGPMMRRNGVSLIGFEATGEPTVYEVWPGEGGTPENPVYTKWLCLVPTVTKYRMLDPNDRLKTRLIDVTSFQVAVADKQTLDWTFINGTDTSVAELRGFFTSLPANMVLPEVKKEGVE